MTVSSPAPGAAPIQSVTRAAELLKAIGSAVSPPTVGELAETCGLQRATAWRLLVTLEQSDLVERTGPRSGFRIGSALLSMRNVARGELERLTLLARPELERLSRTTGLSAGAGGMRLGRIEVLDQVDPPSVVVASWVGKEFPLHTSSPGKLLLADLDERDLLVFLERPLARLTPRTITDRTALRSELERVRREGFAVSDEEFEIGCVGISTPVRDEHGTLRGFLTLSGPNYRMPAAYVPKAAAALAAASRRTSRALGRHAA